jgi:DNA mismatch endonuclease (patch repair protein)
VPGRRRAMQRQKTRDTAPEMRLRRELHRQGLRFRVQRKLLPDRRRTVDIVFPGSGVAVDVRGCFWHRCPEHFQQPATNAAWWDDKLRSNVARDQQTVDLLQAAGYDVVVVWEHEPVAEAVGRIVQAVAARAPRSPSGP